MGFTKTLIARFIVSITLAPLDGSLKRTFTLNPSKTYIEIGRASKTASKGLAASKDNAWFDSPIMSRSHAEFSLVTKPEKVHSLWSPFGSCQITHIPLQALHLKDLKSTHGTYVGGKRLTPDVDCAIKSGDHITFGQKVTSGLGMWTSDFDQPCFYQCSSILMSVPTAIYPAKEFRIDFHWQSWRYVKHPV